MPKFTSPLREPSPEKLHRVESCFLNRFTAAKIPFFFSMQNNHEKTTAEEALRLEAQSLH